METILKPFLLLVTGSRTWKDKNSETRFQDIIFDALAPFEETKGTLIHGGAQGADTISGKIWEKEFGLPVEIHRPQYDLYGRRAPLVRDVKMVARNPHVCLAFIRNHSSGATYTAGLAEEANIIVHRWTVNDASNRGSK